jgi:hypothetical protein
MQSRPLIFVVISALIVVLVCGSFIPFAAFVVYAKPPESGWSSSKDCTDVSKPGGSTAIRCCWRERVPGQILGVTYCQTCTAVRSDPTVWDCKPKEKQALPPTAGENIVPGETGVLEQPPTSSPFNPTAPLQGGVLEQQEQTPPTSAPGTSPGVLQQLEEGDFAPGFAPGFLRQQEEQAPAGQGATELPAPLPTEGTQPDTVEEEQPAVPVCQEGLEFNENLGFCVPTECPEGQVLDEETGVCVLEEPEATEGEEEPEQQTQPEEQDPQQEPSEEEESSEENSN